jgi:hypothetical protein
MEESFMDDELTHRQKQIRLAAREFAEGELVERLIQTLRTK